MMVLKGPSEVGDALPVLDVADLSGASRHGHLVAVGIEPL